MINNDTRRNSQAFLSSLAARGFFRGEAPPSAAAELATALCGRFLRDAAEAFVRGAPRAERTPWRHREAARALQAMSHPDPHPDPDRNPKVHSHPHPHSHPEPSPNPAEGGRTCAAGDGSEEEVASGVGLCGYE